MNGRIEGEEVWIVIQDHGIGMDKQHLHQLQEALENDYEQNSKKAKNIGLFNVQSRIKHHFGPRYGIHLESDVNQGMKVTINLPRRESDDDLQTINRR